MDTETCILKIEDLAVAYGSDLVLSGVSFTLDRGEVLIVAGQNGSGKSTLLKTIGGLLPRKAGRIFLSNVAGELIGPHRLVASGVSYVTQGSLAIPALTVREHFELVLYNRGNQRNIGYERVFEEFPGLKMLENRRAGNLSGGERQLLSFAILTLQQTRVWMLDEPTSGLSPAMVRLTVDYLARKKREGISMLLVEHNMEVAFELATQLVIAKGGTLTGKFGPDEFLDEQFSTLHLYT